MPGLFQPDPGTTVVGRVVDTDIQPFAGASVTVFERFTAQSLVDGTFSISGVPTIRGSIIAAAEAHVAGLTLRGASATAAPVPGGTTDVGTIALKRIIQGSLYPGPALATGNRPTSVAVADLNGDGRLDIVTANAAGDVSILLGNGDGTFQVPERFAAGSGPQSMAVADLNGDGKLDIVTGNNFSNDVSVLLRQ